MKTGKVSLFRAKLIQICPSSSPRGKQDLLSSVIFPAPVFIIPSFIMFTCPKFHEIAMLLYFCLVCLVHPYLPLPLGKFLGILSNLSIASSIMVTCKSQYLSKSSMFLIHVFNFLFNTVIWRSHIDFKFTIFKLYFITYFQDCPSQSKASHAKCSREKGTVSSGSFSFLITF